MAATDSKAFEDILARLIRLEQRLSRVEQELGLREQKESSQLSSASETSSQEDLELQIGQYWFAKVGIVALALGMVFFISFPFKSIPNFVPSLFGYGWVLLLWAISRLFTGQFELLGRYLFGGGVLLSYFATLRLHFFSANPVVTNHSVMILLLLANTLLAFFISLRRNSVYLTFYSFCMLFLTALVSNHPLLIFSLLLLAAVGAAVLKIRYGWRELFNIVVIFTYITHLIWFINNPILGQKIELQASPEYNLYFLLLYILVFAIGTLFRYQGAEEDAVIITGSFLNCALGFGLLLLITLTRFTAVIGLFQVLASAVFLAIATLFWLKEQSKFSTFFYAMTGYMALSVAIVALFPKPEFFVWLCWQSLLVISTAILFRSRFIVWANFVIFLMIFFVNLYVSGAASLINLSFGVVALLSARIMNWQKERLELKTEFMRNAYLITAFFIIPFTFYQTLPREYVGFAWIGIAVLYYVLSGLLNNFKYRWMGHFTLLLSVVYILFVSLVRLSAFYRVLSFLVLGLVLITISILYTRQRSKQVQSESKAE